MIQVDAVHRAGESLVPGVAFGALVGRPDPIRSERLERGDLQWTQVQRR